VNISSLFTDKAYSFQEVSDNEDDKKFASLVLKKIKPKLKVTSIEIEGVFDDFDLFSVVDEEGQRYNLKISLDDSEGILKHEATALKNNKCFNIPDFVKYDTVEVGENVTCLLSKVADAESIRNYGRSIVFKDLGKFVEAYTNVFKTKKVVRRSYNKILEKNINNIEFNNFLPTDSLEAFKSYTDYSLCVDFLKELRQELIELREQIKGELNFKCHSSLSLDSIFYGSEGFHFEFLHNLCMGHPYVDIIDLMLELGIEIDDDSRFCKLFCEKLSVIHDESTYNKFYQLQIRKKLAELVISYIKEVYLYDSFRYQKIFFIADTFSHCYKRFCAIDIFKKNREFIMKTICEPIFGVKA
jgi:hypothetical protein